RTEVLIDKKTEFDRALLWLKKGEEFQINPNSSFFVLPDQRTTTPSSEFRIIEDHESDKQEYWTEIEYKGKNIRPSPADILIMMKASG
ncbi:MAG: hypothetical protein AAF696_13210, partial [Bacteroidota bacterium]